MKASKVYYEGHVQGVGFRWTVHDLAKGYEVTGTVRNLADGRVELVAAGPETAAFLKAIRDSALAGHIETESREEVDLPERPRGFRIVA